MYLHNVMIFSIYSGDANMDVFRMRYDEKKCKIKISESPDPNSFFQASDGNMYYLGLGKYNNSQLSYLKAYIEYMPAFKIEIINDLLLVNKNLYFISFSSGNMICDMVFTKGKDIRAGIIDLYDSTLWQLYISTDTDSTSGKKILLQNLLPEYDPQIDNLPEELTLPTKNADLKFCYEYQPYSTDYVPFDKVVGFNHGSISYECSWIDSYLNLHRMYKKNYQYLISPEYYKELESGTVEPDQMSFLKVDDYYFISEGAHRCTVAKLIGIKGLYATVSFYKTAYFYKNSYELIKNFGFDVELYGCKYTAYNEIIDNYNRKNYEAFKVSVGNNSVLLLNEEMITEFIDNFNNLDQFYMNTQRFFNKAKSIYNKLFKNNNDIDEKWYKEFIEDAVTNFFVKNFIEISKLRNR